MSAASVALYNRWRDLMRSWGHAVLEVAGCDTRSASSGFYDPSGLFVEHHDASSTLSGNWGALATITQGRGGANPVPGPLANLQYARDGQVAIVAKNPANHAGVGGPLRGVPANLANLHSCGAEVANNGLGEPYDPRLTAAIVDGEAAWAIVTGRTADYVVGHKEWADGRKSDPRQDMNARRAAVAARITAHLQGDDDVANSDEILKRLIALEEKIGGIHWMTVPDAYAGIRAPYLQKLGSLQSALLPPPDPKTGLTLESDGEVTLRLRNLDEKPLPVAPPPVDVAAVVAETVRQMGAVAVAPQVMGGLTADGLAAFAKAAADEQDRRARDGDPATGPVS